MARLERVSLVGFPHHVVQRGNNRQVCFVDDNDFIAYANWLKEYSLKCSVDVHALVLMSNHVHILCTPNVDGNDISQMMQSVGRMYVRYFNKRYQRTGTLWEGRYKSCVVESKAYLLRLYRYIELNPVRAGIVNDPSEYRWSSYQSNGLGKESKWLSPHSEYQSLGENGEERATNYRQLFAAELEDNLLKDIRRNVNSGLALGNQQFQSEIEELTGRRATSKKPGRPKKGT